MNLKVLGLAVAGGALLGGGGAAAGIVLAASPDQSTLVVREVRTGDQALLRLADQMLAGRRLADIQAAGAAAMKVAEAREAASRRLVVVEDGRLRAPGRRLVDAQAALARAIVPLAAIDRPDASTAEDVRDAVLAEVSALAGTRRALPVELRAVVQDPPVESTMGTAHAADLLRRGERRLAAWRMKRASIRRARKSRVAVLDSYASSFNEYLAQYQTLRTAMGAWIRKVDSEGETFEGAYDFLADASAGRSRLRAAFRSLDAPKVVARQHNQVMTVLDRAVQAVDEAYDGIVDLEFDFDDAYDSYKDTPGWRSFTSTSDAIASEYDAAVAAWRKRLAHTRKGILESGLPARPEI